MKLRSLFLSFFAFSFSVVAQDSVTVRDVFAKKGHFELSLNNGFTLPTITSLYGPLKAYKVPGIVMNAGFLYSVNLLGRFGVFAGVKVGAYPTQLGIPKTEISGGTDMSYFQETEYWGFAEFSAGILANYFIDKKYVITTMTGAGFKFTGSTILSSGYGTYNGSSTSVFELESSEELKPFILVRSGFSAKLKNHNLLGLNLSYYYSLKDIYTGTYFIASKSPLYSYGDLRYKGHEISLGICYTFTGYKKKLKIQTTLRRGISTKREAKKLIKGGYYQKRIGNSNSIRAYAGGVAVKNRVQYADRPVKSFTFLSGVAGMDFTREFKPTLSWEAGWNYHEYISGFTIKYNGVGSPEAVNLFRALQLSAGAGYILRSKYFFPRLYISAGAAMVLNTGGDRKGLLSEETHISSTHTGKVLTINSKNYLHTRLYPLLYLGINKDVRLIGNVFFSLSVRRYQGLYKIYTSQMVYKTSETGPTEFNTSSYLRGSYTLFALGFKVDL